MDPWLGSVVPTLRSTSFSVPAPCSSSSALSRALDGAVIAKGSVAPVSYTHLDVYKRQGLGHGNLGSMLLSDESKCFAFLAGHESFAAAEGAIGIVRNANKARKEPCLLYTSRCV